MKRKKFIEELGVEGMVLRDPILMVGEFTRIFQKLYTKENCYRPLIEGLDWCSITPEKAVWLERPFEEEITSGYGFG